MIVRRSGDWLSARVAGELVMMSVEAGRFIGSNDVGARIWEVLDTPKDFDALCTQLSNEFDVLPEVCRIEVETFLETLAANGAISIEKDASA